MVNFIKNIINGNIIEMRKIERIIKYNIIIFISLFICAGILSSIGLYEINTYFIMNILIVDVVVLVIFTIYVTYRSFRFKEKISILTTIVIVLVYTVMIVGIIGSILNYNKQSEIRYYTENFTTFSNIERLLEKNNLYSVSNEKLLATDAFGRKLVQAKTTNCSVLVVIWDKEPNDEYFNYRSSDCIMVLNGNNASKKEIQQMKDNNKWNTPLQ